MTEKKTILIVDDSADTRLILSARLQAHHYRTVFAADAVQAMSIALKERPDVILLDLGLPGGNGLLVLQRFKANTFLSGIPVLIVSAEDPQTAEARTRESGAAAFLQKPVDHDALIAAVQHAVGTI